DAIVEMRFRRIELFGPRGDGLAEVLRLVFMDEPMSDVLDVRSRPVEALRIRSQKRLHVGKQLLELDRLRLERDLLSVAVSKSDRCGSSSRLKFDVLKLNPVACDLVQPLASRIVRARTELIDRVLPLLRRLRVLAAIFVDLSERIGS